MKRVLLFVALLSVYAAWLWRSGSASSNRMDAVAPRAGQVEQAIAAGRFLVALPIAQELGAAYPAEPLVQLWLAAIHRGLDRPRDEAAAWERFIVLGSAPSEACPGLADAYARAGDERALPAYRRCTEWDPHEPERLIDLAAALERAGNATEAIDVLHRAARLDPQHPVVAGRIEHLSRRGGDSR